MAARVGQQKWGVLIANAMCGAPPQNRPRQNVAPGVVMPLESPRAAEWKRSGREVSRPGADLGKAMTWLGVGAVMPRQRPRTELAAVAGKWRGGQNERATLGPRKIGNFRAK